jgi:hypothetical protein
MSDVLYLMAIVAFFTAMVGVVKLCARQIGGSDLPDMAQDGIDGDPHGAVQAGQSPR